MSNLYENDDYEVLYTDKKDKELAEKSGRDFNDGVADFNYKVVNRGTGCVEYYSANLPTAISASNRLSQGLVHELSVETESQSKH